jgi:hypothetical protein
MCARAWPVPKTIASSGRSGCGVGGARAIPKSQRFDLPSESLGERPFYRHDAMHEGGARASSAVVRVIVSPSAPLIADLSSSRPEREQASAAA